MRNAWQAVVVSEAVRRARWVEAEAIHLKLMGLFFCDRGPDRAYWPQGGGTDDTDAGRPEISAKLHDHAAGPLRLVSSCLTTLPKSMAMRLRNAMNLRARMGSH
jgi:hypothetical protein